jgi:hypothetical protein
VSDVVRALVQNDHTVPVDDGSREPAPADEVAHGFYPAQIFRRAEGVRYTRAFY